MQSPFQLFTGQARPQGKVEISSHHGSWRRGRVSAFESQRSPGMPVSILAIIAIVAAPTTLRAGVSISEYSTPTVPSQPLGITTGPDGALWFTEFAGSKIGRITTTGKFAEYTIPTAGSEPRDIANGPDGALWFAEYAGNKIGRITTAGVITEYLVGGYPQGITAGPDGAMWFTEISGEGENIGRITTAGMITEYPVGGAPDSITTGPDGALWFTESDVNTGNKIGRITTAGAITEYPVPTVGSEPEGITAGPDGALWFTEFAGNKIGRITTAGVITEYPVTTAGSIPNGITTGPDGALWFTESAGNKIGRITTAAVMTEYSLPTAGSDPHGITTGPDGALWFTEDSGNRIGRARYTCANTMPPLITSIDSASSYGGYPYFASGSWLEIKGSNLADPTDPRLTTSVNPGQWRTTDFNGVNAPTVLDGISVSINGKPAYVWYLSPEQLNVQGPEDTATGNVAITATNCTATSSPVTFTRRALAPGLLAPPNYTANGTPYMVATFASDGAYVLNTSTGAGFGLNSRPAKPGDLIIAYGVGFGDVTPSILPGVIAEQSNALNNPVTFSFGSTNATLWYAGLAGNFVGLYEFYIAVPQGLANGDHQINVTQNGISVPQTMYLTVHD
jgi:virginiamycin B lyase